MQSVVVAARPMVIGTAITAKDVKLDGLACGEPRAGCHHGRQGGRRSRAPDVGPRKRADNDGQAGFDRVAAPACRRRSRPACARLSVKVNDVIGVAGFIVPGSRVDVVVTIRRPNDSMTRTAASNVQVLTAGTPQGPGKPRGLTSKTGNDW